MDLDPASWGGLELGLKIGPVKTSTVQASFWITAASWFACLVHAKLSGRLCCQADMKKHSIGRRYPSGFSGGSRRGSSWLAASPQFPFPFGKLLRAMAYICTEGAIWAPYASSNQCWWRPFYHKGAHEEACALFENDSISLSVGQRAAEAGVGRGRAECGGGGEKLGGGQTGVAPVSATSPAIDLSLSFRRQRRPSAAAPLQDESPRSERNSWAEPAGRLCSQQRSNHRVHSSVDYEASAH